MSDLHADRLRVTDVVRGVAAAALVGAAAIHFAYAPMHFDDQTSHGVFFVVAGWAQLLLGMALAVRARPGRPLLGLTLVVDAGLIGVWILSRTAGVPGNEAEPVDLPDVLATSLEVVAVLAAGALLLGIVPQHGIRRAPTIGLAGVAGLAAVVLVSMSVTPSIAGSHDHGGTGGTNGHGHETADGDAAAGEHGHAEGEAGADHAAMEGAGGEDWNATRTAALTGYLPASEVDRITGVSRDYLRTQILQRSPTLGSMPEAERTEALEAYLDWVMANVLEGENGQHGADGESHAHGPTPWIPLESPEDQVALQDQLDLAGTVIPQFPTAADATAGGYFQVTPYVPGIGAHYINPGLIDGTFDPGKPEMLLYNGNSPTSELVGLSYGTIGSEPPAGFVGENDTWHNHPSLCMVRGLVVGPDHTPDELCSSIGGEKNQRRDGFPTLWMAHLWQVPGWESHWGMFSGESPAINLATTDVGR